MVSMDVKRHVYLPNLNVTVCAEVTRTQMTAVDVEYRTDDLYLG